MLLLRVFEDALGAEHFLVLDAVELHLLRRVGHAELNLALHCGARVLRVCRGCHGQASQHLVVHGQIVRVHRVGTFVVRALNDALLRQLSAALKAE